MRKLNEWASASIKIDVSDIITDNARGDTDYIRMADDYFIGVMAPLETQDPLYALRIFTNIFTNENSSPVLMKHAEEALLRITRTPYPTHALAMLRYLEKADCALADHLKSNDVLIDQMIHLGNMLKDENPDEALAAYLRVLDGTATDHPRFDDLSLKIASLAHKIMPTYTDIATQAVETVRGMLDDKPKLLAEIDSLMAEPHGEDSEELSLTLAEFKARHIETVTAPVETPVITP